MPRITNLMFTCIFIQLHLCVTHFIDHSICERHEIPCPDGTKCILIHSICNGINDCDDKWDERNCSNPNESRNVSHLACDEDKYRCKNGDCIWVEKFCDSVRDCIDDSDEYDNCEKDAEHLKCYNKFHCNDKKHCIPKDWICDGLTDCLDGSDELNCKNEIFNSSICHKENNRYLCENKRCIILDKVCDKYDNCGDGSDEGSHCSSHCLIPCNHNCKQTPKGSICTCRQGFELRDNHTCIDTNECQIFGICDQKCENIIGSYICSCETGYTLRADKRTCEVDDNDVAMTYYIQDTIFKTNLKSKDTVPLVNLSHVYATSIFVDTNYTYWSHFEYKYDSKINIMRINNARISMKHEVIINKGLRNVIAIAVDWITCNIYFVDNVDRHIAVCSENGIYCNILFKNDNPSDIVLLPEIGTMYWTNHGANTYIAMAGMDGKNKRIVISENIDALGSIAIDYRNNRLYWVNKLSIESSRLDGTDRRIILRNIYANSIAVFENKLYWTDWMKYDVILSCDKFFGNDTNIYIRNRENFFIDHLQVVHTAMKSKFPNPCLSKPCSELCLLNQNGNYTCSCIPGQTSGNSECNEAKHTHLVIAANNTIINYYHQPLGNTKIDPSYIKSIPMQWINKNHFFTAITCDALSGAILGSDRLTNHIIKYDPINDKSLKLFPINSETIGGMAFDYIGNNLYLTNKRDKSIEVYSLTTMNNTVFYYDETPYDIALIPEQGEMFVTFRKEYHIRGSYIKKIKMNGIDSEMVDDNIKSDTLSLHYNSDKKEIYPYKGRVFLEGYENTIGFPKILTPSLIHLDLRTEIANVVSDGDSVFWTLYNSDILSYMKIDIFDRPMEAFEIPITANKPLVTLFYKIDINEKRHDCQNKNGNCSHLCLPSSNTTFTCACPHKMVLSADNRTCVIESKCPPGVSKCNEYDICVERKNLCDNSNHCPYSKNYMDNCNKKIYKCTKDQFACKNGICINSTYRCNSHDECGDHSDEDDCTQICEKDEYKCRDKTCISSSLVCDGKLDCPDYSDEFFIDCLNRTCPPGKFKCENGKCIPMGWVCDSDFDCSNGEDEEKNCREIESFECDEDYFACWNRCISHSLVCNGINDCGNNDKSDELYCAYRPDDNCNANEYHCLNTTMCLPKSVRCNGITDCPKNDDENCCSKNLFMCDNLKCIWQGDVCDKVNNCEDNSDEKYCIYESKEIKPLECKEYTCSNESCLPFNRVCNGIQDCVDNADENGECAKNICERDNPCEDLCYNTPKGTVCGCHDGYYLAANNISCHDVNECEHNICSQICRNTMGSFTCSCTDRYFIRDDRISCKAIGKPMKIITATMNDIRSITPNLHKFQVIHSFFHASINSFDVNAMDASVYWSNDKFNGSIHRFMITTKEVRTIENIGNTYALAIDWITNNTYFIGDGYPPSIKVCNFDQFKCARIYEMIGHMKISALVLDPIHSFLFLSTTTWTHSWKPSSAIYRMDMASNNPKRIVSQNIGIVSGMAIDHTTSRLYWLDNYAKVIESSNLDGSERKMFLSTDHQPLSINIFENSLYWLMGASGSLQSCKLYGNNTCTTINVGPNHVNEHFAIFQISRHPPMKNPCNDLNCDYMCVLSAKGATCICQDGKQITDDSTCIDTFRSTGNGGIYSIIIIVLLIVASLPCAYYYYRRKTLKVSSDQSFDSIRFNTSHDRDDVTVTLNSIISQSRVSSDQNEYVNPLNDYINNASLKIMEENNTKMSEGNSEQWEDKVDETTKQDTYLIPEVRRKKSKHDKKI